MPRAGQKDTTGRLWVEEGQPQSGLVAEVAPVAYVDRTYSYSVPAELESGLSVGRQVQVPLGRRARLVDGFVVDVDRRLWESTLRPIHCIRDDQAVLTPELIGLAKEIAEQYCCRLGLVLKAMAPEAARRGRGLRTVRYIQLLRGAEQAGDAASPLGPKQRLIVETLRTEKRPISVDEVLRRCGASSAVLRSLVARRWVELVQEKEVAPEPEVKTEIREPDFELTGEQQAALQKAEQRLAEGRFHVTLLFGVSGSGKTEIYLRAIRRAVAAGRQAILLVPEILLTTQLVERLTSRLPGLAVMHSGLTEAHRSLIWRRVAAGKKTVVVGPRSAVFAPCPNLGLICVDEEQEAGYKNLRSPRFHVRDVAILRAKKLNIPVLLGSATPSLEMWHLSETHSDYERVYLRHRVKDRPLPKVHLIDMRQEYQEAKGSVALSRRMLEMIEETLAAREQAMILINRRGSSRRVFCPACRMRIACPNCGVSLVVHADTGQSICHYCRHRIPTPVHCPNVTCAQPLIQTGAGSQRVEALLRARFPAARIQRVDTDSLKRREQYHSVVNQLSSGELDIAVGTQMIAKGLDFPGVSFVGVVDADAVGGLAVDFRAHERLFQLMTQVAGRAGRGDRPGRVVVQTTSPELPALHYAVRHDYEGFAASELPHRKALKLPPYRRLVRLIVSHTRDETARREANEVAQRIRERIQAFEYRDCAVSGPHTPVFARLRGRYRHDVLLAVPTTALMRRLLRECTNGGDCRVKSAALTVDVDPVQLA